MRLALILSAVLLCGCKAPEESHMKVVLGAVMLDGSGGPPASNSIVVVAGGEIREVGTSSDVAIPAEADRINGAGRFLIPGLVDVCPQAEPPSKGQVVYIHQPSLAAAQEALDAARESGKPALAFASTRAEVQALVDHGASGIIGMITDTEELSSDLLARLRDLKIVFAPALSAMPPGAQLEVARRNTRRLFAAGIPIAAASRGGDILREAEALSDAGIPPLDVIVAATRNGAMALHELDHKGTIQPGRVADLLVLSANPGEDIRNLRRVAGRLIAGEWSPK